MHIQDNILSFSSDENIVENEFNIIAFLKQNPQIKGLDFVIHSLSEHDVSLIMKIVKKNPQIKLLGLSYCSLSADSVGIINHELPKTHLTDLDLSGNTLPFEAIDNLTKGVSLSSTLTSLSLCVTGLGRNRFKVIKNLENSQVRHLDVSTSIALDESDRSVSREEAAQALASSPLESLNISQCRLTDAEILEITEHFNKGCLKKLNLRGNLLTAHILDTIALHISGSRLIDFEYYGENSFSHDALISLNEAISTNQSENVRGVLRC